MDQRVRELLEAEEGLNNVEFVRFEFLTAELLKIQDFRDMTPCRWACRYLCSKDCSVFFMVRQPKKIIHLEFYLYEGLHDL